MTTSERAIRELISPEVDAARLFGRTQQLFRNDLEILRLVAASPHRALFVARDTILKRQVALRVQLTPGTPLRRWFERETELLAALDHPVLRPVYSAGFRGDWAYRIVKWIEGESLADTVRRGPRPVPAVLQLARDLTSFLEYVHTQRIVVRQIAPTTVMVDGTERTLVTDLRYANILLDVADRRHDPTTLPFLAPEVRGGAPGEPSSDIYAAGALLYFAVTGRVPDAAPEAIVAPRRLRAASPRALERVILRALHREIAARYLTAAEMSADLLADLGEYDVPIPVAPGQGAGEDDRAWEQRLRRALGDDYELLEELGAGGFGRVYRVRDLALEREVALKVLHPYLTADPTVIERFRREAQLAAQLHHPNIVSIYDTGGRAGLLWYTMAYVRGRSLATVVQREGPLAAVRLVRLLQQALDALDHAHRRGLVHRDLKPENLLIEDETGAVRIADFGLVVAFTGERGAGSAGGASSRSGTPEFAAPEQLLGEPVDHRADLYSLTLAAYYALTGRPPIEGGSVEAVVARHVAGRLPDLSAVRRDVPDRLLRVLARGAARNPAERYESARDYAQALRETIHPWRTRARRLLGGLLGAE